MRSVLFTAAIWAALLAGCVAEGPYYGPSNAYGSGYGYDYYGPSYYSYGYGPSYSYDYYGPSYFGFYYRNDGDRYWSGSSRSWQQGSVQTQPRASVQSGQTRTQPRVRSSDRIASHNAARERQEERHERTQQAKRESTRVASAPRGLAERDHGG